MSSFKGRNTLLPSNDLSKSEIKDKPISLIFLTHVCLVFRFLSCKPVHFRPYAFQEKGAKLVATMNPRALRSGCTLCVHRLSVLFFFLVYFFFLMRLLFCFVFPLVGCGKKNFCGRILRSLSTLLWLLD